MRLVLFDALKDDFRVDTGRDELIISDQNWPHIMRVIVVNVGFDPRSEIVGLVDFDKVELNYSRVDAAAVYVRLCLQRRYILL